jgi:hypothetical protein
MKYIKNTFNSFSKKRLFIFVLLFSLAGYSLVVFAVAPVGGYIPGQTLDPACAPGDTDCMVAIQDLTFDSPLVNTGGIISLPAAAAGVDGYLSASDWNNFNDKQDSFGFGTSSQYLRGDNTWQNLDTSVVPENGNLYFTNGRFDTRLAAATSAANLQTVGTITSGVWQGSQITDAYISDSITASNYIPLSQKGAANGVASLGSDGKVLSSQLSSFSLSDTFVVNSEIEMLNLLSAELGDVAIRLDENKSYILTTNDPTNSANWQQIITPLDFVLAVNGQTGAVNLTTTDIPEGLNLYYTDTRVDDYLNTQKGMANGIASLDANGKIPSSQLGSIILNETRVVVDIPAMLAIVGAVNGDLTVVTSTSQTFVLADDNDPSDINSWVEIVNGAPVTSVNGQVGTVNLTTTNISEGSNQYFTNTRARNAFSATGPLNYNAVTGVFGITQSNNITNGFLSAVDWNTFNDKQDALTFGSLTASSNPEITITGGTGAVVGAGLDITIPDASDSVRGLVTTGTQNFAGVKSFNDNVGVGDTSPSELFSVGLGGLFQVDDTGDLIKIKNINYSWPGSQGATDSVLVNDGSGGLTWSSNGVTSLNGLTDATQTFAISSTGTDFDISSSGGIHTFNFPTASATARGALTSTKYTEFNNKPLVDTIYNNIYVGSISAGTVMNGASGGINNIVMGYQAGDTLSTGNNNTLLGYQSGKSITTGVAHAFFAGYQSGLSATSATNSIFIGRQAGSGATSASFASFLGRSAGLNATGAQYGIFVGDNAGNTASSASNAIFLGQNAGYQATSATFTNAIGTSAGYQATGATTANFIGYAAGYTASDADYANMIGRGAGNAATNAQYSNFLGFQSGYNASNAANSIFIGKNAGYGDLVNNTVSGSSIAIGDSAGTGGNSNSIALGASAINTLPNQFLIGSSYTNFNVRGINYVWPAAQAAGSGYVLTNDGSGGLSWSTGLSIGGTSGQLQYNNAGALGGVSGITFDGTNFDAKDSVFRIVDNSDTTKRAIFEVSGIDTGTTRTYTLPNTAGTIALTSDLSGYLKNSIGIAGGTTLIGGTASGQNLTLQSTSNATKGKIIFGTSAYDEVNNRLGIGTTTPGNLLSIVGNSSTFGGVAFNVKNSNVSGDTRFSLSSSNNRTINVQVTGDNYPANKKGAYLFTDGGLSNMTFMTDGDVSSGGSGYISFATGGYTLTTQERMRITSTGNIGIGITSPTALLMLAAGTATASTAPLKFTSGTNLTTPEAGVMEYDGTSLFFTPASTRYNVLMNGLGLAGGQTVVGGTASGNNLTLSSTSNATKGKILFGTSAYDEVNNRLGIGTTNPGGILDIYKFDNSNPVLMRIWNGGSGGAKLRFVSETGGTAQHQWTTDKFLAAIAANNTIGMQFRVGLNATEAALDASTRMTITTDGNVGIGTASPSYRFSVSDTTTAGIVGSFTNSDGTCTLDPGDVSGWSCPSDLNLKKDIETLTSGSLDNILALRPVTYRLINEDSSANISTGLIAQEVQTVFPKLVKTQIDGTLALNYGGLTPYMISAIQEMNLRITEINDIEKPNTWRDALIAWFANTANGITEFFSKKVSTEELCVTDSAGQTCITRTQLDALLNGQGVTPAPTPDPTPSPDPVPTPDPGTDSFPSPDPETETTPPSDIVLPSSDPAPTSEPVPDPDPPSDDLGPGII